MLRYESEIKELQKEIGDKNIVDDLLGAYFYRGVFRALNWVLGNGCSDRLRNPYIHDKIDQPKFKEVEFGIDAYKTLLNERIANKIEMLKMFRNLLKKASTFKEIQEYEENFKI